MKNSKVNSFSILLWGNKNRINKSGEIPIYLRITINGKRAEMSTNRFVDKKFWMSDAQRVKDKSKSAIQINGYLDMLRGKVLEAYNQLLASNSEITAIKLKSIVVGKPIQPKTTQKTILDALTYHNNKMEEKVRIGQTAKKTIARYQILIKKITAFMKLEYKAKDIPLTELRLRFATDFEHYLLINDNLQVNTAHKYIKNLKKVMNMSVGLDWISSNPFTNFRCSYTAPKREVLTQEEIDRIRFKKIDIKRLAEVRDVFIFCCYTGFAYSDIYNFEHDAITKGIDGEFWLATERQKTGVKESVPLLPVALEIIEKYRDHNYCINKNRLLPVNSNQRYNGYLKEIADICGIKKKITSHIARHTFATTVTLSNGVPIETVSSMLGHSSIRTTQIYAKVLESKVSEDMKSLKNLLSQKTDASPDQSKIG